MHVLIVKLGATGDVVRTTALLRCFHDRVTWLTSSKNSPLLEGLPDVSAVMRVLNWNDRSVLHGEAFDLAINLEDDIETAAIFDSVQAEQLFGAYAHGGRMSYTTSASEWFDMSLILCSCRLCRRSAVQCTTQNGE